MKGLYHTQKQGSPLSQFVGLLEEEVEMDFLLVVEVYTSCCRSGLSEVAAGAEAIFFKTYNQGAEPFEGLLAFRKAV